MSQKMRTQTFFFLFLKTDQWGWISSLNSTREQSTAVRRRIHSTFLFLFIFSSSSFFFPLTYASNFPTQIVVWDLYDSLTSPFSPFFVGKSFHRKISFAAEDSDSGSVRFPCVLNHVITSHGF